MDFVARAYVIENGRTVLEGTRDTLLGDPNFTRTFLGLE
jgi:branched-chain amino acid transport system ATP-binding protein